LFFKKVYLFHIPTFLKVKAFPNSKKIPKSKLEKIEKDVLLVGYWAEEFLKNLCKKGIFIVIISCFLCFISIPNIKNNLIFCQLYFNDFVKT